MATVRACLLRVGIASALALGCGGGSTGVSCDLPMAGACYEWQGVGIPQGQQLIALCMAQGGTWAGHACPREQVYFGCKATQAGVTETQWSTVPITASAEQTVCPSPGMVVAGDAKAPDGGFGGMGGLGGTGGVGGAGGSAGMGGGGSGGRTDGTICPTCTVSTIDVDASHLVFDGVRQRLYATVAGGAALYPNTVAIIDPAAAMVESLVAAGSDPDNLALADDASTLWVGLDGAAAVRSIDLTVSPPSLGALHALPVPTNALSAITGGPMVVLPGAPRSVAVTTLYTNSSPAYAGTYILDDGVARPTFVSTFAGPALLTGGPSPYLFGFNDADTGFDFFTLQVTASGVTATSTSGLLSGFDNAIVYGAGRVLAATGEVIDVSVPAAPLRAGRFDFSGPIAPRGANQAVMFSPQVPYTSNNAQLRVLDISTFTQTVSVAIPQVADDTIFDLQVVGSDAVAFIGYSTTSYPPTAPVHRIYVLHAAAVLSSTAP